MVVVLKPLQIATTSLCYDENVSISVVFPVLNALKRFKDIVKSQLKEHFSIYDNGVATGIPVLASSIDP